MTTTVTPRLNTGLRAFATTAPPYGMDVSNYQGNINWPAQKAAGAAFVYIKATENTTFQNPYFAQQYNGAYAAGLDPRAPTTSRCRTAPAAPPRRSTSSPTAADGPATGTPCRRCWTSNTTPTAPPSATA